MEKPLLQTHCTLFKTFYWKKEDKWCFDTKNGEVVSFGDVLLNPIPEQVALVDQIRSLPYKSTAQMELKTRVWGITPSSVQVGGRGQKYHAMHSHYISFDIDKLGDTIEAAFEIIKKIPFVCYCGRSVSGNGLWGLIKISNPEKHKEHFDAMQAAFMAIGIPIDPAPRNVASLRFICYDPSAYLNENALVFTKIIEPVKPAVIPLKTSPHKPLKSGNDKSSDNSDTKKLIEGFNSECTASDMHDILTNYGFNYHSTSGSKYRFTRPGKDSKAGLSVDYHADKRTLYSFSSEVPLLDKWKSEGDTGWSCSPMTALLLYGFGGTEKKHWAQAFNYIKSNK